MTCFLTFEQVQELTQAAVNSELILGQRRLLFRDVKKSFAATLPIDESPITQFKLDLNMLNCIERLEDGTVPLTLYLRNAADEIRDLPESKIFLEYQNLVQNRSSGSVATLLAGNSKAVELPAAVSAKEAIIHQDDTLDWEFLTKCLTAARSVGKLVVPRYDNGQQKLFTSGQPWASNGTGWLVTTDLLITNHHLINSRLDEEGTASPDDFKKQGENSGVLFDYHSYGNEAPLLGVKSVEISDVGLDYCILRLSAPTGRPPLNCVRNAVRITAKSYLPVNLIHHPNGMPKRFTLRNSLAVDSDADLLRYYTNTTYGSGGSPVLDDRWWVVALHRGAVYTKAKFQGQEAAFVNVGTQISRILDDVQSRRPDLYALLAA